MNEFIKQMIEEGHSQEDITKMFTEVYNYEKEAHEDRLAKEAEAAAREKERLAAEQAEFDKAVERDKVRDAYFAPHYLETTKLSSMIRDAAAAEADVYFKLAADTTNKEFTDEDAMFNDWYKMYENSKQGYEQVIAMINEDPVITILSKIADSLGKKVDEDAEAACKKSTAESCDLHPADFLPVEDFIESVFKSFSNVKPKEQKTTFAVDKESNEKVGKVNKTNKSDTSDSDYFKFLF